MITHTITMSCFFHSTLYNISWVRELDTEQLISALTIIIELLETYDASIYKMLPNAIAMSFQHAHLAIRYGERSWILL